MYIVLSQCWGTKQNFTTTKVTFNARMKEIAWDKLPKTYRDAINVARRLHIRYIWIDSCVLSKTMSKPASWWDHLVPKEM
jgi:hypothetical protein